jgi:hypothetical protein
MQEMDRRRHQSRQLSGGTGERQAGNGWFWLRQPLDHRRNLRLWAGAGVGGHQLIYLRPQTERTSTRPAGGADQWHPLDLNTIQSSLEEIFVDLVRRP